MKTFFYVLVKNSVDLNELVSNVDLVNLAIFYLSGKYPSILKRILKIEYRSVVKMDPHAFSYEKIGWIILIKTLM